MKTSLSAKRLLSFAGTLLPTLLGLACWYYPFAGGLVRLSYDFPFAPRSKLAAPDIALVYIDDASAREFHQNLNQAWDRRLHARLLDRLTQDGAKAVIYDIVFLDESADPGADDDFAAAMQRNGHVILGAELDQSVEFGAAALQAVIMPEAQFRRAAAGRGLLALRPVDPDYGIRRIFTGTDQVPSATWLLAEKLGAVSEAERSSPTEKWINYLGSNSISSVSFAQALSVLPPGYFRDRVVFIGGRPTVSYSTLGKDEFATPYTRWGARGGERQFATGMEVHANILSNLLHRTWLTRLPPDAELAIVLLVGLAAGIGLRALRPDLAAIAGLLAILLLAAAACLLTWHWLVWFNWTVPALVEVPSGVAWSVGWQYFTERRRRAELKRAFALYLSPQMADRIANSGFDLKPGGTVMDATVVFTDLKGFTSLSEDLGDPEKVSQVLVAYFNNTTGSILENNGTIVKYIGDAVFAVWGAPLEDPDHHYKGALAALGIHKASGIEIMGRHLTTRIGVNSGKVLSGNLGSSFRFDYTCIGDTTNFASRLEGLNKYLGTDILIGDETYRHVSNRFITRALGRFIVVGKKEPVAIHELIALRDSAPRPEWCDLFQAALASIHAADYEAATKKMHETIAAHGGADGPSAFYLHKMKDLADNNELATWDGCIRLTEK